MVSDFSVTVMVPTIVMEILKVQLMQQSFPINIQQLPWPGVQMMHISPQSLGVMEVEIKGIDPTILKLVQLIEVT